MKTLTAQQVDARLKETRAMAEKIADELFTDGDGKHAKRLVMEIEAKLNGSGWWCKGAVVDRIIALLSEPEPPKRAKRPATALRGVDPRPTGHQTPCRANAAGCRALKKEVQP